MLLDKTIGGQVEEEEEEREKKEKERKRGCRLRTAEGEEGLRTTATFWREMENR